MHIFLKSIDEIFNFVEKKNIVTIFLLILGIFFISYIIFDLNKIDFGTPPLYGGGDGILIPWFIKNLIKFGNIYNSNLSSAPTEFSMYRWPIIAENIHFFSFKVISFFTKDIYFIYTLYFLTKFYIIGLLTFFSLKLLKISNITNLVIAILFVFSPIAFSRYLGHYFLGIYYAVPCFFGLCIYSLRIFFQNYKLKINDYVLITLFLAFISLSGIYYAYFSTLFFLILFLILLCINFSKVGLTINYKTFFPLIISFIIVFIIILFSLDVIIANFKNNYSLSSVRSNPLITSDIYGLKISWLFLPISNHISSTFAEFKNFVNSFPLTNENSLNSVGLVSSLGLTILLFWPFVNLYSFFKKKNFLSHNDILENKDILFVVLNVIFVFFIYGLLISSIGGLSLFLMLLFAGIRAYSRISIFFCFFGLVTIAIIIQILKDKLNFQILDNKNLIKKILINFLLIFILFAGLIDQIGKRGPLQIIGKHFKSDKDFFAKVENQLSKNSKVFILPVLPFPEHPPFNKLVDYDHIRAHIHSENLHFNYPAFRESNSFKWQANISNLPIIPGPIKNINFEKWDNYSDLIDVERFLSSCKLFGFEGIIIDKNAFYNNGEDILSKFQDNLNDYGFMSNDERYVFFKLDKSPIILEVNKNNYPVSIRIEDRNLLENFNYPDYLNQKNIIDKINSNLDNIEIYNYTKKYFDSIYKN